MYGDDVMSIAKVEASVAATGVEEVSEKEGVILAPMRLGNMRKKTRNMRLPGALVELRSVLVELYDGAAVAGVCITSSTCSIAEKPAIIPK